MLDKDRLFGQKDVLDTINKRVSSFVQGYRQNIAILGDELLGKTFLIKYFLSNHLHTQVTPIYVSMESLNIDYFAKNFCGSLLHNFLRSKGIKPPNELDILIAKSYDYIPNTADAIKKILSDLSRQKSDSILQMVFDLPALFTKESQNLCLVVFDEFHRLEDLGIKNIFQELGKRIMLQKNIMYILVASLKTRAKRILEHELSLLFGNFENIEIEPFDCAAADKFIEQKLINISIAPVYKEFIINLCGGSPYYLDVVSQELIFISNLNDKTTLSLEDIIDAFGNILFDRLGRLNSRFENKLSTATYSKGVSYSAEILLTVASGINKLKNISASLDRSKKEILQRLSKLIELNLVSQNGSFYRINDRVFSFWLRVVYRIRRNSFGQDTQSLRELFRAELQAVFDRITVESRKKSTDRIIELFNLFKDDSVCVERWRVKLADFKEVTFFSFDEDNMRMLIMAKDKQDTLWITFLKEDIITEEDVMEFSRCIKKNDLKARKKIMIGLSQIDHNARLKALKEKMLVWDRKNINQLFELYGKPTMPV